MGIVAPSSVVGAYDALRKRLIQTTLRNRMINYRPPGAKALVGLQIEREVSTELWRLLIVERKKLGFTGPPDPPKSNTAVEESEQSQAQDQPALDVSDMLLFTNVPKTRRDTRLLATFRASVEQFEERGVNTLFLALGMLRWKEPLEKDTHLAPLILIPVHMERMQRGDFKVSHDEGEIATNLCLKVKLEEFGVAFPDIPSELDAFAPEKYFDEVARVIEEQDGWEIIPDSVALSFFSFEKIALYLDLAIPKWAEDATPLQNSDIQAALGSGYAASTSNLNDETDLDATRSPHEAREIFPADSSQLLVIEVARRGTSMVVEGPPGTGKSQTITNLLAEFVSQGKRILFVSEKMAALEVVYRNLERAGIANAALKLHGHRANRREFFSEIKRTWSLHSKLPDATLKLERFSELRGKLNQYVKELHEPLAPYGASPRKFIALACSLPQADEADSESGYDPSPLQEVSWNEMERFRLEVELLQKKVGEIGLPCDHPYWGSTLEFVGPDERLDAEHATSKALNLVKELTEKAQELSVKLRLDTPTTLSDISALRRSVETALAAPPLNGVSVHIGSWKQREVLIRETLAVLREHNSMVAVYDSFFVQGAWDRDWTQVRTIILRRSDSFFGRLSGEYRQSAAEIQSLRKDGAKLSPPEIKASAEALFAVQNFRAKVYSVDALMSSLFGVQWSGLHSSPDQLEGLLRWVLKLEEDVHSGVIPQALVNLFQGQIDPTGLLTLSAELESVEHALRTSIEQTTALIQTQSVRISERSLVEIESTLSRWNANTSRITEIVGWNLLAREAREKGLATIVQTAATWPLAAERLEAHVLWHWSRTAIRKAFHERPALRAFERLKHEQQISEFVKLDEEILRHNRARVAHSHLAGLPPAGAVGLTAELFRQCELRARHKSIRWAFEKFDEVLLSIKPICMMSPLSVATFLPAKADLFDVVIFDEASQVKPEDSLSAIARAKQTIVVGDTRQMPPTSFFDALASDDEVGDDSFDEAIGKMESVLAMCSAAVQNSHRRRDLRWHYRSLHESLIQPSNRLFYEDRLVVFPSPVFATSNAVGGLGLRFRYDPNSTYDRGAQKKINAKQAEDVAAAAIHHIRVNPQDSLMVVAFSKDQQQAIQDVFERMHEPGLMSEYGAHNPHESFVIKNLETVQGDERDVVLISVGYGRDIKGQLSMNFGPLNKEGGGRRLNVLITRARKRTEVFSSIRAGDILVDEGKENGVSALKVFLEYAETGILDIKRSTGEEEDSQFEVEVRRALEGRGHTVDAQIGTAGFRIDLAVRHPLRPGTYILGIECDGATYHRAKSARDRDKLRQQVLESRGWRIHRIWSTDWWQNRQDALERCLVAIEQAIQLSDEEEPPQGAPASGPDHTAEFEIWSDGLSPKNPVGSAYRAWQLPFELQGYELHELPPAVMAKCVRTVVGYEGPIHLELLVKRIRESAGLGRAGARIRDAVLRGLEMTCVDLSVIRRGDFLYWSQAPQCVARSRAGLPSNESNFDWVAQEEIDEAILETLKTARQASEPEISEGVRLILGYQRTPNALPNRVKERISTLLVNSRLIETNGQFKLVA